MFRYIQQIIQDRLREEIRHHLIKNNGKIVYDDLNQMPYLDMIVKESLRMYPALPFIERKCMSKNGYKVDEKLTIPYKMQVIMPSFSLHYDPKVKLI